MTLAKAQLTCIDKRSGGADQVVELLRKVDKMLPPGQVSTTVSNFLTPQRPPSEDIEFMFNPKELSFESEVKSNDNAGSRSMKSGKSKVSFSNIEVCKIGIRNIVFDTYETGENVVDKYIGRFKKAVQFTEQKQRPPVYTFSWGQQVYLKYCFIEKFSYKLTLFLADGTPVRAIIDTLTLKETDPNAKENANTPPPQPDRNADTPESRGKPKSQRSQ
jgi:Contractile injection system tube protein